MSQQLALLSQYETGILHEGYQRGFWDPYYYRNLDVPRQYFAVELSASNRGGFDIGAQRVRFVRCKPMPEW